MRTFTFPSTFPSTLPSVYDTTERDIIDANLNTITNIYFGWYLVCCPQCEQIHRITPTTESCICGCGAYFEPDEAPDLFF